MFGIKLVSCLGALAACCSLCPSEARAQTLFEWAPKHHLPPHAAISYAGAFLDVDGDLDLDLVVANQGQNTAYRNDGHGRFSEFGGLLPTDDDETHCVVAFDFDRDGDLDLVWGNDESQNRALRNDGGTFVDVTATVLPGEVTATRSLDFADIDADGDMDLAIGNHGEPDRLYRNDSGVFVDVTATQFPATSSYQTNVVQFADADLDGDADLLLGSIERLQIYANDGLGTFVDASASRLPAGINRVFSLATADLDSDGDLDIALGTDNGWSSRLLDNDGDGNFGDVSNRLPQNLELTAAVGAFDIDGDSDVDLLFGNGGAITAPAAANRLFLNDGSGSFSDATAQLPKDRDRMSGIVIGDIDGDADLDWLACRLGVGRAVRNALHLNDGAGTFDRADETGLPIAEATSRAVAIGDVNGDGYLDVFFGNEPSILVGWGGENHLHVFDPETRRFVDADAGAIPADVAQTEAAVFVDADADADLDLVIGGPDPGETRLLLNDGAGTFTDVTATRLPGAAPAMAIAVGDVDGDTDPDIVLGAGLIFPVPLRLYRNDGQGFFTEDSAASLPGISIVAGDIELADVDGDLDLDVIAASSPLLSVNERDLVLINDGSGVFTDESDARLPATSTRSRTLAVFDADGDADADIYFANNSTDELFVNDGSGFFSVTPPGTLPDLPTSSRAPTTGDFDGDGDLDLVVGKSVGSRFYENDGTGTFADTTATRLQNMGDNAWDIAAADVDRDGDLDMVIADSGAFGSANHLLVNATRQLVAPWHLVPGLDFVLEHYANPGFSTLFHIAIPIVGRDHDWIEIPAFGGLALDPSVLITLDPVYLPPFVGRGRTTIDVPNDPALADSSWHFQALDIQLDTTARFTNSIADRVLR